ncbi:glycosyl hydrolase family 47-domain-containing protein [Peziza echinospora]|nr:glycosyl hydrolase family 47-domain-containing protein [Peziza echinospora]
MVRLSLPGTSGLLWLALLLLALPSPVAQAKSSEKMTVERIRELREEARTMLHHGFDNYMLHAFPGDEIKPITCTPNTRTVPPAPSNLGLDDVLGNFSVTAIDTLSTLAILAESDDGDRMRFWRVVEELRVRFYPGEGAESTPSRTNKRGVRRRKRKAAPGQGFDIDSRVQVFEATIRVLGGLLSAHLYATGEFGGTVMPVPETLGLTPPERRAGTYAWFGRSGDGVRTRGPYAYDGHLLDLAHDLGERLLPAFTGSASGVPYARVNLRRGLHFEGAAGDERNRTCPAGAGSLVLEFAVLTRLTGDARFEAAAKRAFAGVWAARSARGLLAAGLDVGGAAAAGEAYSGIGAGLDSFFEYAFKAHVLLQEQAFHDVWARSHAAIARHVLRPHPAPHYVNVHYATGAAVLPWIDSLSAFYPGLLALAGRVAEAEAAHLLYTALWQRYAALPERWSVRAGAVDGGLGWWPGRPEFAESTYMLHRATADGWYLRVGAMALADMRRRCRSRCGWAGLQDVETGERADRMESFVLGETLQYLFLLFDGGLGAEAGWLNGNRAGADGRWVFTTEGHPLVVPRGNSVPAAGASLGPSPPKPPKRTQPQPTCENPRPRHSSTPPFLRTQHDVVAHRPDLFHATYLTHARLPPQAYAGSGSGNGVFASLHDGSCSPIPVASHQAFDLIFPDTTPAAGGASHPGPRTNYARLSSGGMFLHSLSGLRLSFLLEPPLPHGDADDDDGGVGAGGEESLRITQVNHVSLGRDERVYLPLSLVRGLWQDDNFVVQERGGGVVLDFIVDVGDASSSTSSSSAPPTTRGVGEGGEENGGDFNNNNNNNFWTSTTHELLEQVRKLQRELEQLFDSNDESDPPSPPPPSQKQPQPQPKRLFHFPAIIASGHPSNPLPPPPLPRNSNTQQTKPSYYPTWPPPKPETPYGKIYLAEGEGVDPYACSGLLEGVPGGTEVVVIRRGGGGGGGSKRCTFTTKVWNIPIGRLPRLRVVVIVDFSARGSGSSSTDEEVEEVDGDGGDGLWPPEYTSRDIVRPMLEGGRKVERGVAVVMVGGGRGMWEGLRRAVGVGVERRWEESMDRWIDVSLSKSDSDSESTMKVCVKAYVKPPGPKDLNCLGKRPI